MAAMNHTAARAAEAAPGGAGKYFYLLFTHFFRLFALNLLLLVCCLPVITIPAAITGACRAVCSIIRGDSCYFWREFYEEFKTRFLGKLGCWLLLMLLPFSLMLWTYMLGGGSGVTEPVFLSAMTISILTQCYFFVLTAVVELPLGLCLKNAALLLVLEWKDTLCMLVVLTALAFLLYNLYPYSLVPAAIILPSGTVLFVCRRCLDILERRHLLLDYHDNTNEEAQL
ncbi:MAG: DUF624 domain-containing protein [Candidatus Pelethousia sp.]|nr:DUF624 domain-containing protein [Candidatus Pelethousia sp.]